MVEVARKEMFWAAVPYSIGHGEGEELSPWEERHELREYLGTGDGWPSFQGYCGELKLQDAWHSLWQFDDPAKAKEFAGKNGHIFTQTQVGEFVANGQWCKHNKEEDDDDEEEVEVDPAIAERLAGPDPEWFYTDMPEERRRLLHETPLADIFERLVSSASVRRAFTEKPDDPSTPRGTFRVIYQINVSPEAGDLFFNGRDGIRARYWLAPELGDDATLRLIDLLTPLCPSIVSNSKGKVGVSAGLVAQALALPSSKVWVLEAQLRNGGMHLNVPRWPESDPLWKFTPQSDVIEIKSGWLTPMKTEWISEGKKDRARQIHRQGFS